MLPTPFRNLIDAFSTLPGVGPRMAERIVLYLFKQDARTRTRLADAIRAMDTIGTCAHCFNITADETCAFCRDTSRDTHTLCVVEEPLDIIPIERTGAYRGLYHVLGGTLAPGGDGSDLTIDALVRRIRDNAVREIILATNPTTDGDATALYIRTALRKSAVRISRLARGLTTGADIEHADDLTLRSALTHRETLTDAASPQDTV